MTTTERDVETPDGRRPESSLGRKRDDERTQAIVDAAGEVLLEVGFDGFRVQDVAERAGSGTGAIYRRWATKEALVADAIRAYADADLPHTDDALADLRAAIDLKMCSAVEQPDLLPSMVAAMRANDDIAAAVDERYTIEPIRDAVARVVGDDHPLLDLLAELAPAMALHRATFGRVRSHEAPVTDDVLALVQAVARATESDVVTRSQG